MPLAEKVKNLSAICKVCGAGAAFTFKFVVQAKLTDQNIEIGGSDLYMPLCRECFNEKTIQQNAILKQEPQTFNTSSEFKAAFDSSSTLAESNQKSNSD
jgi:hypothetical protein